MLFIEKRGAGVRHVFSIQGCNSSCLCGISLDFQRWKLQDISDLDLYSSTNDHSYKDENKLLSTCIYDNTDRTHTMVSWFSLVKCLNVPNKKSSLIFFVNNVCEQ